jgi:hypothetical protein
MCYMLLCTCACHTPPVCRCIGLSTRAHTMVLPVSRRSGDDDDDVEGTTTTNYDDILTRRETRNGCTICIHFEIIASTNTHACARNFFVYRFISCLYNIIYTSWSECACVVVFLIILCTRATRLRTFCLWNIAKYF